MQMCRASLWTQLKQLRDAAPRIPIERWPERQPIIRGEAYSGRADVPCCYTTTTGPAETIQSSWESGHSHSAHIFVSIFPVASWKTYVGLLLSTVHHHHPHHPHHQSRRKWVKSSLSARIPYSRFPSHSVFFSPNSTEHFKCLSHTLDTLLRFHSVSHVIIRIL